MKGQKGLTLIETVIALAIMGAIAVAIFLALNVSLKTTASVDQHTTAESLTRTALELIKQCAYDEDYPETSYQDAVDDGMEPFPNGYDVEVKDVRPIDDGIQEVMVEVYYDEDGSGVFDDDEVVLTTTSYKADL